LGAIIKEKHMTNIKRLVIGKKPPPEKRDNNGNTLRGEIFLSSEFPGWLIPSKNKLERTMDKIKRQIIVVHSLVK